ncbi:hypothetical protein GGR56DRAFT_416969 [Xylariaceae sp. FL0804]|nr:hypothetical protein GGR56DRAFT_416969 [Xylariaceae sp. FL0804]
MSASSHMPPSAVAIDTGSVVYPSGQQGTNHQEQRPNESPSLVNVLHQSVTYHVVEPCPQSPILSPAAPRASLGFSGQPLPPGAGHLSSPSYLGDEAQVPPSATNLSRPPAWKLKLDIFPQGDQSPSGPLPALPAIVTSHLPPTGMAYQPHGAEQDDDVHATSQSAGPVTRKRGRNPSDPEGDGQDEAKRGRGRPRLDASNDETPGERRRTQIRQAQRAYRSRKETKISVLQSQVASLKEGHREIKHAYQHILDLASQLHIPQSLPAFGHQLEQFQTLLDKYTEEQSEEAIHSPADGDGDATAGESHHVKEEPAPQTSGGTGPIHEQTVVVVPAQAPQLWNSLMPPVLPVVLPTTQDHVPDLDNSLNNDAMAYEVIAAPTWENASFAPQSIDFGETTSPTPCVAAGIALPQAQDQPPGPWPFQSCPPAGDFIGTPSTGQQIL